MNRIRLNPHEYNFLEQAVSTSYDDSKARYTWGYIGKIGVNTYAVATDGYIMNIVRNPQGVPPEEACIQFEHSKGEPEAFDWIAEKLMSVKIDYARVEVHTTYQVIQDVAKLSMGDGATLHFRNESDVLLTDWKSKVVLEFGYCNLINIPDYEANYPAYSIDPLQLARCVYPDCEHWTLHLPYNKLSPIPVKSDNTFSSILMPMQLPS